MMAALSDIPASELSFGDLDQDLEAEFGSTAAWLSGSDFDLLLGGQGAVIPDALKLDASSAPKEQAQNPASVPPPRTAPFSELFQGFPSTLFQGSNYRREFGASFDLPDLSGTAPRLQQQLSNPPPAQNRQNANNGHQKEQTPFGWPLESPTPSPAGSSKAAPDCNSPAKSESGETPGLEILGSRPSIASTSPGKSNSWQRGGVLKKSNKAKPKLRAQTAQVAELKGQVAQLTARCHSMEQVLTQQQLTGSSGDLRASPTAAEANEANLRSIPSTGSPAATAQVRRELKTSGSTDSIPGEPPLANLTSDQFGNLYRSYVSRVAVKLGMLPLQNNQKEVEDLRQSASEVLLLVMRCCMENSVAAKLWMQEGHKTEQARLESDRDGGQYLVGIITSLALTEEQKQAILQLRQAFLNRLEGIQKARQEIVQGLTGSGPSAIRNRASAVAQLGALQKIEAFVANVKECDRLICDFVSSLMSQILTPLQMARCLVAAYPYWPDTLAISTYIAAAAGESSAIGLLRQEFAGVSIAASS